MAPRPITPLATGTYLGSGQSADGTEVSYTVVLRGRKLAWLDCKSGATKVGEGEFWHSEGSYAQRVDVNGAGDEVETLRYTVGGLPGQKRAGQTFDFIVEQNEQAGEARLVLDCVVLRPQADTKEHLVMCDKCGKRIVGQSLNHCGGQYHKECFTCDSCNKPLTGRFTTVDGKKLCVGCTPKTYCFACKGAIEGKATSADGKSYHPRCFVCSVCSQPLTGAFYNKGDQLYCKACLDASKPPPKKAVDRWQPAVRRTPQVKSLDERGGAAPPSRFFGQEPDAEPGVAGNPGLPSDVEGETSSTRTVSPEPAGTLSAAAEAAGSSSGAADVEAAGASAAAALGEDREPAAAQEGVAATPSAAEAVAGGLDAQGARPETGREQTAESRHEPPAMAPRVPQTEVVTTAIASAGGPAEVPSTGWSESAAKTVTSKEVAAATAPVFSPVGVPSAAPSSQPPAKEAAPATPGPSEYLSLADLQNRDVWKTCGVDPAVREAYLSDEEFASTFGMAKAEFAKLPRWKQNAKKKEQGLF